MGMIGKPNIRNRIRNVNFLQSRVNRSSSSSSSSSEGALDFLFSFDWLRLSFSASPKVAPSRCSVILLESRSRRRRRHPSRWFPSVLLSFPPPTAIFTARDRSLFPPPSFSAEPSSVSLSLCVFPPVLVGERRVGEIDQVLVEGLLGLLQGLLRFRFEPLRLVARIHGLVDEARRVEARLRGAVDLNQLLHRDGGRLVPEDVLRFLRGSRGGGRPGLRLVDQLVRGLPGLESLRPEGFGELDRLQDVLLGHQAQRRRGSSSSTRTTRRRREGWTEILGGAEDTDPAASPSARCRCCRSRRRHHRSVTGERFDDSGFIGDDDRQEEEENRRRGKRSSRRRRERHIVCVVVVVVVAV
mmetsp:Transcript_20226/g.47530  ORF Transcript_20226/g.47530 Transcript_20226/m.47530 type:complete len:355 (+) Transcript_20226:1090-2154(+)